MTLDCWSVSTDIQLHGAPSVLLMVLISAIIKYEVQPNMSLFQQRYVRKSYLNVLDGDFKVTDRVN